MSKVFVSHSTRDRKLVQRKIVPLLKGHGLDIWFSAEDISSPQHWERAILDGLRTCDWFLLVMSPDSAQSEWVKNELNWAMESRVGRIVPVLIGDCQLDEFHLALPRIQYVDFRKQSPAAANALLAAFSEPNSVVSARDPASPGEEPPLPVDDDEPSDATLDSLMGLIEDTLTARDFEKCERLLARIQAERDVIPEGLMAESQGSVPTWLHGSQSQQRRGVQGEGDAVLPKSCAARRKLQTFSQRRLRRVLAVGLRWPFPCLPCRAKRAKVRREVDPG